MRLISTLVFLFVLSVGDFKSGCRLNMVDMYPIKISKFCCPNFHVTFLNTSKYPIKFKKKILQMKTEQVLWGYVAVTQRRDYKDYEVY